MLIKKFVIKIFLRQKAKIYIYIFSLLKKENSLKFSLTKKTDRPRDGHREFFKETPADAFKFCFYLRKKCYVLYCHCLSFLITFYTNQGHDKKEIYKNILKG